MQYYPANGDGMHGVSFIPLFQKRITKSFEILKPLTAIGKHQSNTEICLIYARIKLVCCMRDDSFKNAQWDAV
jgi:hypothetical protein